MTYCGPKAQTLAPSSLPLRLAQYARESFNPITTFLIASSTAACCLSVSAFYQRGAIGFAQSDFVIATAIALLFLVQNQIASEWKNRLQDAFFQESKPVPRGLVTLNELAGAGIFAAVLQSIILLSAHHTSLLFMPVIWLLLFFKSKVQLSAHPYCALVIEALPFAANAFLLQSLIHSPDASAHSVLSKVLCTLAIFMLGIMRELAANTHSESEELLGVASYSKSFGITPALYLVLTSFIVAQIFIARLVSFLPSGTIAIGLMALTDMLLVLFACHTTKISLTAPLKRVADIATITTLVVAVTVALY